MTQRDNILKELTELESTLASLSPSIIYQVPGGYFEGLADRIMNRIRSLEPMDSRAELTILSPVIDSIDRIEPYRVPAGYFNGLEKKLMKVVLQSGMEQTPEEELETLSPLLSGLKKKVPYSVPENYFESLTKEGISKEEATKAKVISLTSRKWFRYAAAAIVIAIISSATFFILHKKELSPVDKSYAWVKKSLKKVSTDELDQFIDMADERAPVMASITPGSEAKELMKTISSDEIQNFLDDVKDAEPNSDDDILLN